MIADNQVARHVTRGKNNNLLSRNIVWHLQGDMIWKWKAHLSMDHGAI